MHGERVPRCAWRPADLRDPFECDLRRRWEFRAIAAKERAGFENKAEEAVAQEEAEKETEEEVEVKGERS